MTHPLTIATGLPSNPTPDTVHSHPTASWSLARLSGQLCELSGHTGSAVLSLASRLVLDAQFHNEPTSWITSTHQSFFPPDAAAMGIDLQALVVVRLQDATKRISTANRMSASMPRRFVRHKRYSSRAVRAAEHLARSGGFGLVVLDLGDKCRLSMAVQARLAGLAKAHDTVILCLTDKDEGEESIGSLVCWRAHAGKSRTEPDRFECRAEVSKDKRRGPGWSHTEVHRGPPGLY